jgi:type I restriction enzyme S subunit
VTHTVRLPEKWALAKLGDLGLYHNGRAFKKSEWRTEGRPIIRIQNLTGSGKTWNHFKGEVDPRNEAAPGDLLVSWAATLGAYIWDGPPAVVNQHIFKVESYIDKRFHFYAIRRALDELYRKSHGTGMVHVTRKVFDDTEIPLPPGPEQHRIVEAIESYLTRLDDAVASLERVQRNLERYRASVLKAAVEGRLVPTEAELARRENRGYESASVLLERILVERKTCWIEDAAEKARAKAEAKALKAGKPWTTEDNAQVLEAARKTAETKYREPEEPEAPDTTDLPTLPEGWCWVGPEQLAGDSPYSLGIGPFGSNLRTVDYRDSGVPLVFVRNIRATRFEGLDDKFVSQEKADELRPHLAEPGDVLVTKMGDPPGDASLYPLSRPPAVITADCIKLRAKPELAIGAYLVTAIRSQVVQRQIGGITKGVAQKKVSLARFKSIAIPLPPLAEQERIQSRNEERESQADVASRTLKAALSRCSRLQQAILKWAFEGNLVEQDPDDEPASALLERIKTERSGVCR